MPSDEIDNQLAKVTEKVDKLTDAFFDKKYIIGI